MVYGWFEKRSSGTRFLGDYQGTETTGKGFPNVLLLDFLVPRHAFSALQRPHSAHCPFSQTAHDPSEPVALSGVPLLASSQTEPTFSKAEVIPAPQSVWKHGPPACRLKENPGPPHHPRDRGACRLRAGVPRAQGRLRVGWAPAAAALKAPLPQRLHRALAGAARQLPCLPKKPQRTEHVHRPAPHPRALRVWASPPPRPPPSARPVMRTRPAAPEHPGRPPGRALGRGLGLRVPQPPAPLTPTDCGATRPAAAETWRTRPSRLRREPGLSRAGRLTPFLFVSDLTLYMFDGGKVFIILNYYCFEINGRLSSKKKKNSGNSLNPLGAPHIMTHSVCSTYACGMRGGPRLIP